MTALTLRQALPAPGASPARDSLSALGSLSAFDPITLGELLDGAALMTRVDRKYVLSVREASALLAGIGREARVLQIDGLRSFRYESVYFDTPDLRSYRLAALRRRRRFKVRTRSYLDSRDCFLEVKVHGVRGRTVKHRTGHAIHHRDSLAEGAAFVGETLRAESIGWGGVEDLAPVLMTRYRRSTLFLPASASRVTIDTDLTWEHAGIRLHLPELAVVETKTAAAASTVDRLLWSRRCRPVRMSKYATGLAALRPELPAAPWRRTLRRHLTGPIVVLPSTEEE